MLQLALLAAAATDIISQYETTVDSHISEIMPLFLSDELNFEWNSRMLSQRLIDTREYGQLVWQEYALPWPLANRDLLLHCDRKIDHRLQRVTSQCKSVNHPSAPISDHVVRLVLSNTKWEVTALPGERTKLSLTLELPASATAGVPKFIINYCQRQSLRDSVSELLAAAKRLKLPVHETFLGWARTHAEEALARAAARNSISHAAPVVQWLFIYTICSGIYNTLVGSLSVWTVGALAFAFAFVQGGIFAYFGYRRSIRALAGDWQGLGKAQEVSMSYFRLQRVLMKFRALGSITR